MKIAYDAKRITNNLTGLGNYSRFVVNNLAQQYPQDEFLLLSPNAISHSMLNLLANCDNIHFPSTCTPNKKQKAFWRSWKIHKDISRIKPDLYHGLTNELPFSIKRTGIKSIVTIHDLIFLHYPEFYNPIDRIIYNYKFRRACNDADHIVAVSECTKKDIIKFYHIAPEKISVIYQGCHEQFMKEANDESKLRVKEKFNLPNDFILSVGTIEERKNLLFTIKALKKSGLKNKLVVIGKRTKYAKQIDAYIQENNMQQQVIFLKQVNYTELPVIYQLASLFIYPSLYEGFGIPVIEALHSSTPVIAAKGSCLEEAGGKSTIYIDPCNEIELAQAIQQVLSDEKLRENMINEGIKHVQQFNHEELSKQMMECYQTTISRKR